jgi:ceramide glucosyltransferase
MPKDYIQRLLMSWRHRSGLVCSMPLGSRPGNLWAELECAFLNTSEARWQYCAEAFGMGFAQGKSMLWRREVMDRGAGSARLALRSQRMPLRRSSCAACASTSISSIAHSSNRSGFRGFRDIWLRRLRWARLRRKTFPLFYMPEIIAGAALPCLAAAYRSNPGFEHSRRDVRRRALLVRSGNASRASEQVAFLVAHAFAFHSA